MYKLAILATVGVSILANLEQRARQGKVELPDELRQKIEGSSRLRVDDPRQREFLESVNPDSPLMRIAVQEVAKDPEGMSAELNTIISFLRHWDGTAYTQELNIRLYPTYTGTGIFCAYVIKNYILDHTDNFVDRADLRRDCRISCDVSVLKGFGTDERFFVEGIDELLDKYARHILELRRQGYRVVLAATGGFKPECTYATIIGLLCGVDRIVYIHEAFKHLVELPAIPLDIDREVIETIRKIGCGTYPRHTLEQLGIDVNYYKEKGVLEERGGEYRVAEWLMKVLKLRGIGICQG